MAIVASRSNPVRASLESEAWQREAAAWQRALQAAIRDPRELCRRLDLPATYEQPAERAAGLFPVFAPLEYIGRMRPGDPDDPLLRQVLPVGDELDTVAGFTHDPVGDRSAARRPGLLQKYHGRVLLVTTGACAVHCRYCFRRHYPYSDEPRSSEHWDGTLRAIADDPSIEEVLLSGGDPLMLPDARLEQLAHRLADIPHLRRLRVHTRLPIMIPQRVTEQLIHWLRSTRLTPIVVVHANHPAEIDEAVGGALTRLVDAGIPVLNQAVLLRKVNDNLPDLVALCRRLIDLRVMPYYLHQLDRVRGAAHFEVPVERGRELIAEMRNQLPGYAIPRYVREVAGQPAKQPLT